MSNKVNIIYLNKLNISKQKGGCSGNHPASAPVKHVFHFSQSVINSMVNAHAPMDKFTDLI